MARYAFKDGDLGMICVLVTQVPLLLLQNLPLQKKPNLFEWEGKLVDYRKSNYEKLLINVHL
jgi:hypothetical protein